MFRLAGNFRMETFNSDCLIRISYVDTFNIFFGYSTEKSKTGFSKLESPSSFCILISNGAQNFKFPGFWYPTLIVWILYTFQECKYKIRIVSRLRKREDQALILISTILKFPAQGEQSAYTLLFSWPGVHISLNF